MPLYVQGIAGSTSVLFVMFLAYHVSRDNMTRKASWKETVAVVVWTSPIALLAGVIAWHAAPTLWERPFIVAAAVLLAVYVRKYIRPRLK